MCYSKNKMSMYYAYVNKLTYTTNICYYCYTDHILRSYTIRDKRQNYDPFGVIRVRY